MSALSTEVWGSKGRFGSFNRLFRLVDGSFESASTTEFIRIAAASDPLVTKSGQLELWKNKVNHDPRGRALTSVEATELLRLVIARFKSSLKLVMIGTVSALSFFSWLPCIEVLYTLLFSEIIITQAIVIFTEYCILRIRDGVLKIARTSLD